MPAPNPFESGDDERNVRPYVDNLANDIIGKFPEHQSYVEGVCFDPTIDDIAKRTELEDFLSRVTQELKDTCAQLNDTLSAWTHGSQPTVFDDLAQSTMHNARHRERTWGGESAKERYLRLACGAGMLTMGATAIITGHESLYVSLTGMGMMTVGVMAVFSDPNL